MGGRGRRFSLKKMDVRWPDKEEKGEGKESSPVTSQKKKRKGKRKTSEHIFRATDMGGGEKIKKANLL